MRMVNSEDEKMCMQRRTISNREKLSIRKKREVKTKVEVVSMDLTDRENVWKLHEMYKNEPIEVLVNNAGFGVHGLVTETNLEKDCSGLTSNIAPPIIRTKPIIKFHIFFDIKIPPILIF